MSYMSCYNCAYSMIEESTRYLMCERKMFNKYVQPCSVCESYKRKKYNNLAERCIEYEMEIEVEITVIDNESRME